MICRDLFGNLLQRLLSAVEEGCFLQQIGGGVAADGHFWKDDKVGALLLTGDAQLNNFPDISEEISDRRIDLRQGELHQLSVTSDDGRDKR